MQARLATAGAPLARLGDWLIPLGLAAFGLYETLGEAPPERGAKLLQTLGVLAVAVRCCGVAGRRLWFWPWWSLALPWPGRPSAAPVGSPSPPFLGC